MSHNYTFCVIKDKFNDIKNVKHIHPRKQQIVYELLKTLEHEQFLNKISIIYIFGSSITPLCNIKSDLDITILLKDDHLNKTIKTVIKDIVYSIVGWNCDLIFVDSFSTDKDFIKQVEEGVKIYTCELTN